LKNLEEKTDMAKRQKLIYYHRNKDGSISFRYISKGRKGSRSLGDIKSIRSRDYMERMERALADIAWQEFKEIFRILGKNPEYRKVAQYYQKVLGYSNRGARKRASLYLLKREEIEDFFS
jgi:hypothetical protein